MDKVIDMREKISLVYYLAGYRYQHIDYSLASEIANKFTRWELERLFKIYSKRVAV